MEQSGTTDRSDAELSGTILRGREFEPVEGTLYVEDGEIAAIEEHAVDADRIVFPAFVNAHTHVGDSIAKEAGEGLTLEELVAPPDGLKHRLLRAADPEELVAGMRRSLQYMTSAGTAAFADFREGGLAGVELLQDAAAGLDVEPVILGREDVAAMEAGDGFGASGAADADFADERAATADAGKPFAIHAGEVDATDIDPALELDPDVLVHMVHASERHLQTVADRETPVVVCPRSNLATDVGLPPVEALADRTTVALGTDNVFLVGPSMFREMATADLQYDLPAPEILAMATYRGAELFDLDCGVVEPGRPAKLVVLDGDSHNLTGVRDPVRAVVRRATVADVERVLL